MEETGNDDFDFPSLTQLGLVSLQFTSRSPLTTRSMVIVNGGCRAPVLGVPGVAPRHRLLPTLQEPYLSPGHLPETAFKSCKELCHVHVVYEDAHDSL